MEEWKLRITKFADALVDDLSKPGGRIGGKGVLPEMWPLARSILDGSIVASVRSVADAVRILFEHNHLVAEGAGAASLAAALKTETDGPTVCVITGGNIDKRHMATILEGGIPA